MNFQENIYIKVITSFKNYSSMTLKEVKKKIKQFHGRMKRTYRLIPGTSSMLILTLCGMGQWMLKRNLFL